jgi:ferredoxin-NADP reductase
MGEMMQQMMGGGEHGRRAPPFYSRLLSLPRLDTSARHQLATEAEQRSREGLALVNHASEAAAQARSPAEMRQAAQMLSNGLDLYGSGISAREALAGNADPQALALDWYRDQLGLPPRDAQADGRLWLGLSPGHLLLMAILLVVATALLALQFLRLRRVRALVAGASAKAAPPGNQTPVQALAPAPQKLAELPPSNAAPPGGGALRRPKSWSGELRVAQIIRETPTIETYRLMEPSADRLPFDFLPGQFLQVEVEPEPGKPVRRSYTIASSPTQRAYVELTVKREEQGVVSRYLHDHVEVGDLLKVSGPFGVFTFTGSDADSIVLIAGGVGITPMMSVLRYLTDTAWPGEIFFVYGARSTEEFVFRAEIEQLERRHQKLHVFAAMQRSPGTVWLGPEGVITKEMLQAAVPDIARRRVHLCGPPAMMAAIRPMLTELGVPEAQIHSEAFGPASLPPDNAPEAVTAPDGAAPAAPPAAPAARPEIAPTTVTFSLSGVSAALPADRSVLEAAEGAGVEIPFVCRVGLCGVCVTRLLEGDVTMAVETGLDPADKAQGYVLACQAKSTGAPLVVEA